jgi:hypothetical protein
VENPPAQDEQRPDHECCRYRSESSRAVNRLAQVSRDGTCPPMPPPSGCSSQATPPRRSARTANRSISRRHRRTRRIGRAGSGSRADAVDDSHAVRGSRTGRLLHRRLVGRRRRREQRFDPPSGSTEQFEGCRRAVVPPCPGISRSGHRRPTRSAYTPRHLREFDPISWAVPFQTKPGWRQAQ